MSTKLYSPCINSDNETGRKERGKAGKSPEEPAEKVLGKAKLTKPSPKRKVLKKRESQGKKTEYILILIF